MQSEQPRFLTEARGRPPCKEPETGLSEPSHPPRSPARQRAMLQFVTMLCAALVLAACGGDDGSPDGSPSSTVELSPGGPEDRQSDTSTTLGDSTSIDTSSSESGGVDNGPTDGSSSSQPGTTVTLDGEGTWDFETDRCGGSELEFHVNGQDSDLNIVELDYYGTEAFDTSEPILRLVIMLDNFQSSWVVNTRDEIGTFSDMDISLNENGMTATGPIYLAPSYDTATRFTLDVSC